MKGEGGKEREGGEGGGGGGGRQNVDENDNKAGIDVGSRPRQRQPHHWGNKLEGDRSFNAVCSQENSERKQLPVFIQPPFTQQKALIIAIKSVCSVQLLKA